MSDTAISLRDIAMSVSPSQWNEMIINTAVPESADPRLPTLPAEEVQKLTNNQAGVPTMRAGAAIFENKSTLIQRHLPGVENPKILDFGCGWGRIVRFMPRLTLEEHVFGVDVDERLIAACKTHLPTMSFGVITSGAPLPFEDAKFDVVTANSVFSHLSPSSHAFHIGEIARILRPGGIFLGTTLSEHNLTKMYNHTREWITGITGPEEEAHAVLRENGFVYGSTGRWTDYGIAFITKEWVAKHWAPAFEILEQNQEAQVINVARRI